MSSDVMTHGGRKPFTAHQPTGHLGAMRAPPAPNTSTRLWLVHVRLTRGPMGDIARAEARCTAQILRRAIRVTLQIGEKLST